jgi:hypothetical protein
MARRFAWIAFAGLLYAGSGAARFLHLQAAHADPAIAKANAGAPAQCGHYAAPASETPVPTPRHSSDNCETCFLIAATLKSVAPVLTVVPAAEPLVIERPELPRTTIVVSIRLDAASQRGPPAISL